MADKNECFIHRAIQVLIAACDARHGRDSVSTTASTSNESPRSDDKAAITRHGAMAGHRSVNASRDRMKQEMQHLRDTVEELQRQLDELKREHSRRSPRPGSESSVTSGDDDVASPSERRLALAWEAMARGQCEQRYRAEVENVKLRKMLDEQMKVAQTLERILTKRRHTEDLLGAVRLKKRMRSSSTTVMCPIDDPTVFADLTGVIPALYAQIDVVLQKECFHDHDKVFRDVDVRHTETLGAYVESTERRLLPFTLGETAQSMWEYFAFFPEKIARNCELVPDVRRDHLEREMLVNLHPGRYKGDARVKLVARRFVEPRRTVMVWVAMVDPSDVDEAHGEGVVIRHTGWVCFRPSSLDTPEAAMTEYLTAQLSVPEVYEVVTDRKRRLTTMTNYIVGSVTCQLETGKEMLDNRLLERALARANAVKSE